MSVSSELAKAAVVATLAVAPVLAGASVTKGAGTDNPPPGVTVLQSAQALGPAGEQPVQSTRRAIPRNRARDCRPALVGSTDDQSTKFHRRDL